jgi:rod shape determining protein RodA
MYFVEKTKGLNFFKHFDYLLFFAILILSGIGLVVLYSATRSMAVGDMLMIKQIIGIALGVVLALIISTIDYKDFKVLGIVFYLISIFLLVYVHFKGTIGKSMDSNSWISLPGGFSFQPSEIAKIAFVIVISIFLDRIKEGQGQHNFLKLIIYSVIPLGLVLAQPDYGTALVFVFILCIMLFIYGIKYKYIFGTFLLSIPALGLIWISPLLNDARKNRIRVFLDPNLDKQGASYQIERSMRTIGSGQTYGKGILQGVQTQRGTVPVKESDFIFTVIGEELGFVGSTIIIGLIFFILIRCIYIAKNSRDFFGSMLVIGLTAMIGFHVVENLGMCIGLLPITGIPLPFISSGVSSLITNYIAIGIILSVSIRRKRAIFNSGS